MHIIGVTTIIVVDIRSVSTVYEAEAAVPSRCIEAVSEVRLPAIDVRFARLINSFSIYATVLRERFCWAKNDVEYQSFQ